MKLACVLALFVTVTFGAQWRLRHGPNKELVLQRDVEAEEKEEDKISVHKRCSCSCRRKWTNNDWECCPCPWTQEVCFPGDATLTLEDGSGLPMRNLQAGQRIQTVDENGDVVTSEVRTFLKRQPSKSAIYLSLMTSSGVTLTLSARHLVFVSPTNSTAHMTPRFAQEVEGGDYIFVSGDCKTDLCPEMVTDVEPVVKEGVYVPLTEHGTLLVNNVLASCYSSIDHHIAHAFTTPFRWFPWLLSTWQEDGYSPLVDWLKQFGHLILPRALQFAEVESSSLPHIRVEL